MKAIFGLALLALLFALFGTAEPVTPVNGADTGTYGSKEIVTLDFGQITVGNGSSGFSSGGQSGKVGSYPAVAGAATTVEQADEAPFGSKIGSVYSVDKSEYILLCNLVLREAGNGWIPQSEAAKVVETVFNRVFSSEFPATVSSVIRQEGQFPGALSSFNYDSDVNMYVKDSVISYLNGGYTSHGYLYYWGDDWGNIFYRDHDSFWRDWCNYRDYGIMP